MRIRNLSWMLTALLGSACSQNDAGKPGEKGIPVSYTYERIELPENNTPTVDLGSYTLVIEPGKDRHQDAAEIMRLKRKWPLAMQSLNRASFDSILAKNFTFKGEKFFNREEYINNRTQPDDWKITFVRYNNVTLQFSGDRAILSYVNDITNQHTKTNEIEYEHISWMDVYMKEGSEWKLEAAHAIDYRMEKAEKVNGSGE